MKIQMHRKFWIILFVVLLLSLFACEAKKVNGTIEKIEVEITQVENDPPSKPGSLGHYGSWEEAYASGWKSDGLYNLSGESDRYRTKSKPTGFAIVLLEDGTNLRCKNPFPDLSLNQKVKVKETATGDWVITK